MDDEDNVLVKFFLYQTRANYYLIGHTKSRTQWRVVKISRTEPVEDVFCEDSAVYSRSECAALLQDLNDGNAAHGGLQLVCLVRDRVLLEFEVGGVERTEGQEHVMLSSGVPAGLGQTCLVVLSGWSALTSTAREGGEFDVGRPGASSAHFVDETVPRARPTALLQLWLWYRRGEGNPGTSGEEDCWVGCAVWGQGHFERFVDCSPLTVKCGAGPKVVSTAPFERLWVRVACSAVAPGPLGAPLPRNWKGGGKLQLARGRKLSGKTFWSTSKSHVCCERESESQENIVSTAACRLTAS
jgi:hypothetical protein